MRVRSIWGSYWGRIAWGSIGLFVALPLLVCALGGEYTLGVYIGTGIAVLMYTVETYYLRRETALGVENAWKANQAGLLKQILEEHATSAADRDVVREWWRTDPATAITRYEAEVRAGRAMEVPVHEARRIVSQYFLRLRALCEKGFLDDDLVAATLGNEPAQLFLLYIDPLDEMLRRVAGKEHKTAERDYFREYLRRFFSDTADDDPWGLR